MSTSLTVIILTYNEQLHLNRCIHSMQAVAARVIVVDSYSTDQTIEIATLAGVETFQHPFVNQAQQFQWALNTIPITTDWVMRMDADEYLTPESINEIQKRLPLLDTETTGIYLKRQVHFMGRWIRHGGYYPIKLLRIWRNGVGSIEQRWMDEHIKISHGQTIEFQHDLIDDNLNTLNWWIAKHNNYSTRETVDLLNKKYHFFEEDSTLQNTAKGQAIKKRWYKDNFYVKLPLFFRAFGYYIFRYFFQLGFLDGYPGLIWHFLQGFWYRFLVDAKIYQIEYSARTKQKSVRQILNEDFNFKI